MQSYKFRSAIKEALPAAPCVLTHCVTHLDVHAYTQPTLGPCPASLVSETLPPSCAVWYTLSAFPHRAGSYVRKGWIYLVPCLPFPVAGQCLTHSRLSVTTCGIGCARKWMHIPCQEPIIWVWQYQSSTKCVNQNSHECWEKRYCIS